LDLNGNNQQVASLAGRGTVSVTPGNDLRVAGSASTAFAGTVAGSGSLTYAGNGTLTFAGTGNHSGGTNVSSGTLLVTGALTSTTGTVSVADGAALGGTGTISGPLVLAAGSDLTPGTSVGALKVNNDVTISGGTGSNWLIELGGLGADDADLLDLSGGNGNLDLLVSPSSRLTLTLSDVGANLSNVFTPVTYNIARIGGGEFQVNSLTFSFNADHYTFSPANFVAFNYSLVVNGPFLQLTFSPNPEPTHLLGILTGAGIALGFVRRARQKFRRASCSPPSFLMQ
jgi:autotransporter-associated beta strand protein